MKCPRCRGEDIARIIYGLPAFDDETEKDLVSRKIVLGGCEEDDNRWHCNACKLEF